MERAQKAKEKRRGHGQKAEEGAEGNGSASSAYASWWCGEGPWAQAEWRQGGWEFGQGEREPAPHSRPWEPAPH